VIKIGNNFIVDPTELEESALDARLTLISMDNGELCALQKGGEGPLTLEQIDKMLDLGMKKAEEIRKLIKKK
jgi:exosome complex component RRP42